MGSSAYLFIGLPILLEIYLLIMLIITQVKKDTSIANFVWGGGVLLITLYTYLVSSFLTLENTGISGWLRWRPLLVTLLITLWAGRLIIYVYLRYKGEDPRYQTWKRSGLKALIINFAWIFILNAMMMLIMSVPSFFINMFSGWNLTYLDFIGLALWIIGYYWEAVSDYQLFKFTQNPANKGKVMRYGLWQYSRHPNYFGEVVMWWGIFLMALNIPFFGIFTIIAPITITFLLLFVTGIPWVEKAMEKNPEYQEYKKHTSIFFPWFPH